MVNSLLDSCHAGTASNAIQRFFFLSRLGCCASNSGSLVFFGLVCFLAKFCRPNLECVTQGTLFSLVTGLVYLSQLFSVLVILFSFRRYASV